MSKYRARFCPNCNYFVGFAVAKRLVPGSTASLINFCLNCNYKLPVRTIIRGNGPARRTLRRSTLRLVGGTQKSIARSALEDSCTPVMDSKISPADYARHLRAIGQD